MFAIVPLPAPCSSPRQWQSRRWAWAIGVVVALALHKGYAFEGESLAPSAAPEATAKPSTPIHSARSDGALLVFSVPAGPLGAAVNQFALQAGIFVSGLASSDESLQSPGVQGRHTVEQGFALLLTGTGLQADALQAHPNSTQTPTPTRKGFTLRPQASRPKELGYFALDTLPEVWVTPAHPNPIAPEDTDASGAILHTTELGVLGRRKTIETPYATTGYSAEFIANQQASSVGEALKLEPSVRNFFPDGSLGEYFNMRGFYMQSQEFAWNGLYGLVPTNRSASELLERVEVLRGPGALLYGMSLGGSVGGVINLVPKRALQTPLTRTTVGVASDAMLSNHWDISRRLGDQQQWGVRLNLLKAYGHGAVDGQKENRQLAAIALDYRDRQLRMALDAYSIKESQRDGLALMTTFASDEIPAPIDARTNTGKGIYAQSDTKAASWQWEVDGAERGSLFGAFGVKHQRSQGALNNALGLNASSTGDYTGVDMNVNNLYTTQSAQLGARKQLTTGSLSHTLSLSLNAVTQKVGAQSVRSTWSSNLYEPSAPVLASQPGKSSTQSHTRLNSLALVDTLASQDGRYQATIGVRYQHIYTRNASTSAVTGHPYRQHALTPTVALIAKPWDAPIALYANYIEGLSQGGLVTDPLASNFGQAFAPYKSKQLELGLKWQSEDWQHTLSVFQIKRPSLILNSATARYAPDGEQRNRGIEWTFDGALRPGWSVLGGLARLQAITTQTSDGLLNGKTAAGIPHWQANLGSEWIAPLHSALTFSANAVHTGGFWVNASNTQRVRSWTRWDLGLRYDSEWFATPVVLRLNIQNAFDKRYWSGVWNQYTSVGAPRTYRLSLQMDF